MQQGKLPMPSQGPTQGGGGNPPPSPAPPGNGGQGAGSGWRARFSAALQFLQNTWVALGFIVAGILAGTFHYQNLLAEQKELREEMEDLRDAFVLSIDVQRVTIPLLACRQPIKGDLKFDMERIRCKAVQGDFQPFDASCKKADQVSKLTQIDTYAAMQEDDEDLRRCVCRTRKELAKSDQATQAQLEQRDDAP